MMNLSVRKRSSGSKTCDPRVGEGVVNYVVGEGRGESQVRGDRSREANCSQRFLSFSCVTGDQKHCSLRWDSDSHCSLC
jgi:hypothetical protein